MQIPQIHWKTPAVVENLKFTLKVPFFTLALSEKLQQFIRILSNVFFSENRCNLIFHLLTT